MGKATNEAYMRDETFAELLQSAEQTLEYERGIRVGYRVTEVSVPEPPMSDKNGIENDAANINGVSDS